MSWRRGRTGLELVLPFEREKWFGEKKASRMMETFLLLLLLLLLLGCHLLLHRSDRGGGRKKKKPNCHLHRLGREFTLDVADLKSVVGGALAGRIAIIPGKKPTRNSTAGNDASAHTTTTTLRSSWRRPYTHAHTRASQKSLSALISCDSFRPFLTSYFFWAIWSIRLALVLSPLSPLHSLAISSSY